MGLDEVILDIQEENDVSDSDIITFLSEFIARNGLEKEVIEELTNKYEY